MPTTQYLTAKDEQDYGHELLDVSKRAALEVVVPHLQHLEQQNAQLNQRLAREQRTRLDSQVAASVPNFREIDRNPAWHRWLLGVDTLSGRVRQVLLNDAIAAGAAARVISFFKQFGASGGQASPTAGGWARQSAKPTYTRADIAKFYELVRTGAFTGHEADKDAIERDIFQAQHENRIQAQPYITK